MTGVLCLPGRFLEFILAGADFGEDGGGISADHAKWRLNLRLLGAQERIGGEPCVYRRRQGRQARGAAARDLRDAVLEDDIVGLDGYGEARVGLGIFMLSQ